MAGSGYCSCACRDCCEVAIASDTDVPALCEGCEDAGCSVEGDGDCECPDAYAAAEGCGDDDAAWSCGACGGPVVSLGTLGRTEHGQCRACGLEQHHDADSEVAA